MSWVSDATEFVNQVGDAALRASIPEHARVEADDFVIDIRTNTVRDNTLIYAAGGAMFALSFVALMISK